MKRRFRKDARLQTASGAQAEAKRLQERAAATGTVEITNTAPTLAEFVEQTFTLYYLGRYRPGTQTRYRGLLQQGILTELGRLRLYDISLEVLQSYEAKLRDRGIGVSGHLSFSFVRVLLRAAVEQKKLTELPSFPPLGKKPAKLPAAPSDEDVRLVLEHLRGWLAAVIGLAAFAGLRVSEALALLVGDVNRRERKIYVRRALSDGAVVPPKGDEERTVPYPQVLERWLVPMLEGKSPSDPVIVAGAGRTPRRQHVLDRLKKREQGIGMQSWSVHAYRHHYCSKLARSGANMEAVRQLAGHSSVRITEGYVHAANDELAPLVDKAFGN